MELTFDCSTTNRIKTCASFPRIWSRWVFSPTDGNTNRLELRWGSYRARNAQ